MKKHSLVLALFLVALSLAASAADMPAGGFAGTWKANFAKSKFPGKPPLVDMCTIDPDGTVTVNETNSEGKSSSWHYKPVQGEAVSVIGRENTTVLVTKVDEYTNTQVWNANGRKNTSKAVVSKDGKTVTFTMDGTDKDGKPFHELVIYDKE
jgi:hypothetical protein